MCTRIAVLVNEPQEVEYLAVAANRDEDGDDATLVAVLPRRLIRVEVRKSEVHSIVCVPRSSVVSVEVVGGSADLFAHSWSGEWPGVVPVTATYESGLVVNLPGEDLDDAQIPKYLELLASLLSDLDRR